jgi:hypothetical protein
MTRRDYCASCGEMVSDCDVTCGECHKSLCYDCITAYDPVSRMCVLSAMFGGLDRDYCREEFTQELLTQLIQDIQTDDVKECVRDECIIAGDDEKEYETFIQQTNNLIDTYNNNRDSIQANYDTHGYIVDEPIYVQIEHFFDSIVSQLPFTCIMCHKGIKVEY